MFWWLFTNGDTLWCLPGGIWISLEFNPGLNSLSPAMGPLPDPVTGYGINYTGTQVTQWDFQNKGTRTSPARLSFVLKVPLRNLCPSVIYSVPCNRMCEGPIYQFKRLVKVKSKVVCLPTEHQGANKCLCIPGPNIWKCWFLRRRENRSNRRKTSRNRAEN